MSRPIIFATRGSPLALAQTNQIAGLCREAFPQETFEIQVIKTTGDRIQTLSISQNDPSLPKGLFTKELENALLDGTADIAVHSLKDLQTELPTGLALTAVARREDARDVLITRAESGNLASLTGLPQNAKIATASVRREAQLKALRPDVQIEPIRGNVGTRLLKLARSTEWHGIILAAAGLVRLGYSISGQLQGPEAPPRLNILPIDFGEMLSCVGQGAIAIETRLDDPRTEAICRSLNHEATMQCVTAERAFLMAMGGGCQSPLAAYATIDGDQLKLRALAVRNSKITRVETTGDPRNAASIGIETAEGLK